MHDYASSIDALEFAIYPMIKAKIDEEAEVSFNYFMTKSDYRRTTDERLEKIDKKIDEL